MNAFSEYPLTGGYFWLSERRNLRVSLVTRGDYLRTITIKKGAIDMKTKDKHQHARGEVTELARATAEVIPSRAPTPACCLSTSRCGVGAR